MSKQFDFFLTRNDEYGLRLRLSEDGSALFVMEESPDPSPKQIYEVRIEEMSCSSTVYLVRGQDLKQVQFDDCARSGVWAVDSLKSPVIEFSSGNYNGKKIMPGRMYFTTGYYGPDERWVRKDPEFLMWAEKKFQQAKRLLIRNKSLVGYVGEEASRLLHNGTIKVSSPFD